MYLSYNDGLLVVVYVFLLSRPVPMSPSYQVPNQVLPLPYTVQYIIVFLFTSGLDLLFAFPFPFASGRCRLAVLVASQGRCCMLGATLPRHGMVGCRHGEVVDLK